MSSDAVSCHRCHSADAPVITGVGLLTPLGRGAWSSVRALLEGRRTADRLRDMPEGIDPVTLARATAGCAAGALPTDDPSIELADLAAREALGDAAWAERFGRGESGGEPGRGTLLVVGSSKGAMAPLFEAHDSDRKARCAAMGPVAFLEAGLRRRLAGVASFEAAQAVASACASSLAALHLAWRAILDGRAERALVVSVEAALLPPFVHSYQRLGALAPTDPPSAHVARPLDRGREGFTLCEAASAVALERPASAATSPRRYALVAGAGIGSEAFDIVRAPETSVALRRLMAALAPPTSEPIGLLMPHATGTRDNDEREMCALAEAIGRDRAEATPAYASKGAIGHALGAAGLVNVAISCLLMRIGRRPPMAWLDDPIETPFVIDGAGGAIGEGEHVIVAAGFGGHVGGAALRSTSA